MKGYFNKLLIFICVGIVITGLLWVVNSGIARNVSYDGADSIEILEEPENFLTDPLLLTNTKKALVIYSEGNDTSENIVSNLKKVFDWIKIDYEIIDASRSDTVSYKKYDLLVIATPLIESDFGTDIVRTLDYAQKGGRVFYAVVPEEMGTGFNNISRKIGIINHGGYSRISGFRFVEELIPGSKGLEFESDDFTDSAISLELDEKCKVLVEDPQSGLPIIWSYEYGDGKSVFYNAMSSGNDVFTGMLAGCVMELFDEYMYPVVNAKVVFIDDFPSMQYNSDSDVIKEDYNRTVKEFYRDIWWPDMQSAANKFNVAYTGLFMATYNDIVDPDEFVYEIDEMEQYYGNSLIKNNFEIGAHGYNHQSLTLKGGTPQSMGYVPWKSESDMEESIKFLKKISSDLFPDVALKSYVPPSNYLSSEGRQAVVAALPELKVISGVYTNDGSEGEVYVQDFVIADDGIAEFPRLSSGMLESDYDDFVILNGLGLYGVFSHFIHPDDILDPERSEGQTWQELLDNFSRRLNFINERFIGLRALTASNAADALKIAYNARVDLNVMEDRVFGRIYNYYGPVQFYFKTDKTPKASSDGCVIEPVTYAYDTDYYLVTVSKTSFIINLED